MKDLFHYAEEQAQRGMAQALDHADEVYGGWSEIAYDFLVRFARTRSEAFISEDVSGASKEDPTFPQPPTDRAWGSVYLRAAKSGVIVRAGTGKSRRRHASICPAWKSLIYRGGAQ